MYPRNALEDSGAKAATIPAGYSGPALGDASVTVVDKLNSHLYKMNARAQQQIDDLEAFYNRLGIGEPGNLAKESAQATGPGFRSTDIAMNELQARLDRLTGLINKARQIA